MSRLSQHATAVRRESAASLHVGFAGMGVIAATVALSTMSAWAAESGKAGPSEVIFLAQLIVLMLVGRLLGELMTRIGQPSVMGMLLGGILLGPSVLGLLWPDLQQAIFPKGAEQKAMLDGVAQFGILLLLLLTGMETDLKFVRQVGRTALLVSLMGVAVPFICGIAMGELMPQSLLPRPDQRLITALFLGTALSISSIKIVATVIREMGFMRRNLGQIIIASAICEDSLGWCIIAIIFSLAAAGAVDVVNVGWSLLGTTLFLAASFTVGRRLVFFLIRWANDNFESDFPVVTTILVIMGSFALATHFIGVHTVLGAFVAGVLVGESPILSRHVDEQLRGLILAFFMPVFFGISGVSTDLTVLRHPQLALMALIVVAVASFGKFAGAFAGAELSGLTRREALALGCGMNARGSTEIIVASIGLAMGALNQDLFTIIVAMAVVTTLAMPPMLRWSLARVPLGKPEKERLEREEHEAREFLPNVERLLLAADESPNGNFAARLAGLIAGSRGLTTTVLPLVDAADADAAAAGGATRKEPSRRAKAPDLVKAAAESVGAGSHEQTPAHAVDVTVRAADKPGEQAVANEAKKGYGLLMVGIKNTRTRAGEFSSSVRRVVSSFDGPVAILDARSRRLKHPEGGPASILVPVNGTGIARSAAELAIALAQALGCPMTALHVANTAATRLPSWREFRGGEQARAVIAEVAEMAERYGVKVSTVVHTEVAPDKAILSQAKQADLLVMGVSRRPGDKLFFGDTAAALFQHAPGSVLFLAM